MPEPALDHFERHADLPHHVAGRVPEAMEGKPFEFEALVERYGAAVHVLADNVRQRDPAERSALAALRDGHVASAVASYARRGRIVVNRDRDGALDAVVAGWAADVAKGRETAMYAWRRADVAELNRRARHAWRALGRLHGEELVVPGGAVYQVGDRVVALAPAAGGTVVTSETATVVAVNAKAKTLALSMDDDRSIRLLEENEMGAERLAHGYAVTVHRSQGSTVDRAHALEDDGGRELAYVKMSRAKDRSTVYVVADSMEQAVEDLGRDWSAERRPAWVIDSGTPATDARAVESTNRVPLPMRSALRRARLAAEVAAIAAVVSPDPSAQLRDAERERRWLNGPRNDLATGSGRYAHTPIGQAMWDLQRAENNVRRLENNLELKTGTRKDRRGWRAELGEWRQRQSAAAADAESLTGPEQARLRVVEDKLDDGLAMLHEQQRRRTAWNERHPEAALRIATLTKDLERLDAGLDRVRVAGERSIAREGPLSRYRPSPVLQRGLDLGR